MNEEEKKVLADLQAELTKTREEMTNLQKAQEDNKGIIEDAITLTGLIFQSPELKQKVKDEADYVSKNGYRKPGDKKEDPKPDPDKKDKDAKEDPKPVEPLKDVRVDSLDRKARMEMISKVEGRLGYSGVDKEKLKSIRGKVADEMGNSGLAIMDVPIDRLEKILENSYLVVGIKQADDSAIKSDDLIKNFTSPEGAMPSMTSTDGKSDDPVLTDDHQKWINNLGLKGQEDKVAKNLKELTEKGFVSYKPKEESADDGKKSPSGNPVAPASS